MQVRQKLTEFESTMAFVAGGGLTLIMLAFGLSAMQGAQANQDNTRLVIMLLVGLGLLVVGVAGWLFVSRPYERYDDWREPLYTGHEEHHAEHEAHHAEPQAPQAAHTAPEAAATAKTAKTIEAVEAVAVAEAVETAESAETAEATQAAEATEIAAPAATEDKEPIVAEAAPAEPVSPAPAEPVLTESESAPVESAPAEPTRAEPTPAEPTPYVSAPYSAVLIPDSALPAVQEPMAIVAASEPITEDPAVPVAAGKVELAQGEADDLTLIEGIGPKSAAALNAAGILRFAQVAAMSPEDLEKVVKGAGVRLVGSTDTWPRQARLAADGKMDELAELQLKLKGGRETSPSSD